MRVSSIKIVVYVFLKACTCIFETFRHPSYYFVVARTLCCCLPTLFFISSEDLSSSLKTRVKLCALGLWSGVPTAPAVALTRKKIPPSRSNSSSRKNDLLDIYEALIKIITASTSRRVPTKQLLLKCRK